MSMHFAPQWIKPIKPTGTSVTPTAESPNLSKAPASAQVPFPALSNSGTSHSTVPSSSGLSYSRATHTPTTAGFPTDSSYFPYDESNGSRINGEMSHPFRYSRDHILGLWDEQKVSKMPIELVEMLEGGGVLASRDVVRPNGLRELSDIEKKLLSTSVHPPNPTRRQAASALPNDPAIVGGPASRRTIGATAIGEKVVTPGRIGGTAFQGFGTGKIGTIGGGMLSPGATAEGRMPGALGGGFGGVGRRTTRRPEVAEAGGAWRTSRTASGSFEGVLGFAGTAPAPAPVPAPAPAPVPVEPVESPQSPWKEKSEPKEKVEEVFGRGGGPGWGTGQKKWRIAAGLVPAPESEKPRTITIPVTTQESISESVAASASATPVPERDATMEDTNTNFTTPAPAPQSLDSAPPAQQKEDLGAIEWLYRDPGGQEQGPFTGSQMHEWYSHAYFTDDLPLRRSAESSFHTLAELKTATGNAVQPFLSAVRPRLPPNLPVPASAAPMNGMTDSLRNLGLSTPIGAMPQQLQFNQFMGNPAMHSPNHFAPQNPFGGPIPSSAGPFLPSPGQWGAPGPRINAFGGAGAIGAPSPIGSAPLAYPSHPQMPPQPIFSPVIGAHVQSREFFSPAIGVGAHAAPSPWGAPQPPQQQQYAQQIPPNAWHSQALPQQPQQQQYQQPPQPTETAPPLPQDEPSYFPENEQYSLTQTQSTEANEEHLDSDQVEPEQAPAVEDEVEDTAKNGISSDSDPAPGTPVPAAVSPVQVERTSAPASVWGKTPTASTPASRRTSVSASAAPTPAQSTKASATPAPAASKPASVSIPETPERATDKASEKTPASARPAPWADKEGRSASATGPSLREIQDAEAKQAEARKAARAAAASPAPVSVSTSDELPTNLTWGLPTSQKAVAPTTPAVSTPTVAAWGSGDAAPKKTLKQIQEEEEKRKQKVAQAAKAAQPGSGAAAASAAKRGYADLAATSQAPVAAGWTTVGTKAATPTPAAAPRPIAASVVKPAAATKPITPAAIKPKSSGIDESTSPSLDFIRWTKQSLTGLTVNVDEFIQMLLTFPIDPPASDRAGVLEIISDSVYASSSTLDGRRFAQEFFTRRKADAARPKATSTGVARSSLADVVKSVPKKAEEAGFRVVKAKGKKKN